MEEDNRGWKKFKEIKLDKKQLARRAKKIEKATVKHADRHFFKRLNNIKLVRREVTTWLLIVSLAMLGLGLQLLFSQNSYTAKAGEPGGSYVEAALGPINTLNPLFVSSSAEASVARLLFSSLYSYDETGSIRGDLAKSMTVGGDNKIYTVKLREDAKWHDGEKLEASDVIFTINLIKNPATRSPLRVNWLDVSAKAIDKHTVEFTLPAVYAAFPHALTFPVLPQHILKDVSAGALRESAFSRAPVGSGPFKYRLLQSSDNINSHVTVSMSANIDYYKGAPKLDRFEIQGYPTEKEIVNALKTGEVNGAVDILSTSIDEINTSRYKVVHEPISSGVYLIMNNTNSLLQDKKVRKALQLVTDTEEIRKKLGNESGALDLPLVNSQLKGGDIPKADKPDINRAKTLIEEAGWMPTAKGRSKEGVNLEITITTTKSVEYERVIDILTEQWKDLGVVVKKNIIDVDGSLSAFIQNTLQPRNYDILLYELAIGADPDVYAYWHSSQIGINGYNFANYSSKDNDANLASARTRTDPALRNAKYIQFSRQWLEDVASIGLYQSGVDYVSSLNSVSVVPGSNLASATDRYANILDWTVRSQEIYQTP